MKQKLVVTLTLSTLLFAAIALLFANAANTSDAGEIKIMDGELVFVADMEYIKSLDSTTFEAVIRSSGKKPEAAEYTGIPLKTLLLSAEVDLEGRKQITVKGSDGYMAAISITELEEDGAYIAYEMNGKPIKPRGRGGNGPFQLVLPKDPFSQRWCKFVCEVAMK